MVELLQPFVHRRRRPDLGAHGLCQLRGRLLAELAEPLRRAFEVGTRRRIGEGQDAHRKTDDDRLHARLEQCDPRSHTEDEVDEADPHADAAQNDDDPVEQDGRDQGHRVEGLRVDGRDDDERGDVVDDDHGEHERP